MKYLHDVATLVHKKYGHDFYEALNAAECICGYSGDLERDAAAVHAILEGEL